VASGGQIKQWRQHRKIAPISRFILRYNLSLEQGGAMEHKIKSAVIAAIAAVTNDINNIETAADIATAQIMRGLKEGGIKFPPGVYAGGEENLVVKVLQMRGIRAGTLAFIPDEDGRR